MPQDLPPDVPDDQPLDNPLLDSLRAAVAARPDDLPLRLHLAEQLLAADRGDEAIGHLAGVLQQDPSMARARTLMSRAMAVPAPPDPAAQFDWRTAEQQMADVVAPRFVSSENDGGGGGTAGTADDPSRAFDLEHSTVRLADVGGMEDVKQRLNAAFLAPLRNPELQRMYGKQLGGGLMLYGPPGCGKTFIARAVAGELGAAFVSITIDDVLSRWLGESERRMHELFESARAHAPCVVFIDELDALGMKRSHLQGAGLRPMVNQLLTELDNAKGNNEGLFVLGATNHPWDVDSALRRPGRFDRTVLVLPPDAAARDAILRYHLSGKPIAGIDIAKLVNATDGFSGADLAHLCDSAAEAALLESAQTGDVRPIGMRDMQGALSALRPSTAAWFATAGNVVKFANEGGVYDDLLAYMQKHRML